MFASAGSYTPGSGSGGAADDTAVLASLLATGRKFDTKESLATEGYATWLLYVKQYADAMPASNALKTGLQEKTASMITAYGRELSLHNDIVGTLAYLYANPADGTAAGDDEIVLSYQNLDTRKLEGRSVVAYVFVCESAAPDQRVISALTVADARAAMGLSLAAEHASAMNAAQTGYVPYLDIQMTGSGGLKTAAPGEALSILASYKNLEPGQTYRISATVQDSKGMVLADADKANMAYTEEFTAGSSDGSVTIRTGRIPADGMDGQRLTAYVTLSRLVTAGDAAAAYAVASKGDGPSMGWRDSDPQPGRNQVDVGGASVVTVFTDQDGNKETDFNVSRLKLRDRASYTNLSAGQGYEAVLYVKYPDGSDVLDGSGLPVTATTKFTARASSQAVDIDVTFDGRKLTDKSVVAYNELYLVSGGERILVASEKDPTLAAQTVTDSMPAGRIYFQTNARDDATGSQYTSLGTSVAVVDAVRLQGLDAGANYRLETQFADASTGKIIGQIPSVTTNVRASETGTVNAEVKASINTANMAGRTLVIYETLYDADGSAAIAEHCDPDDSNQYLYVPGLSTFASGTDGSSKTVYPQQVENSEVTVRSNADGTLNTDTKVSYSYEAVIRDRLDYENLTPGNPYVIRTVVVQSGGGATVATQETRFSPSGSGGSTYVDIPIDAKNVMGKDVTVYQYLTDDYTKKQVLAHDDPNDTDQTVRIGIPGDEGDPNIDDTFDPDGGYDSDGGYLIDGDGSYVSGGAAIQTGVEESYFRNFLLAGVCGVLAIAAGCVFLFYRHRRNRR